MYRLGEHFKLDLTKAISNPKNVIKGSKYRITVLTDRLIRFEYSRNGIFEDKPTEMVWFRNMPPVDFKLVDVDGVIEIQTKYMHVVYVKEKPFLGSKINPSSHLRVKILNTTRVWYYNHPEARNIGGPGLEIQDAKGKMEFGKSLYSLDGFVSLDDSKHKIIDENGCVSPRENEEIDIYLFAYLRDFALCLRDYYTLTGYPALIPKYALGNWWTSNKTYKQQEVIKLIDNFDKNKIPLSVLILDKDWHVRPFLKKKKLKTGFSFNVDYFNDPASLIKYIKQKNIKLGLNVCPQEGLFPCDPVFNEAKKYIEVNENGIIPFNVLSPRFIDVYLKFYLHPLEKFGVDLFWIDCCDKSNIEELFLLQHYQFLDMRRNRRRSMLLTNNSLIAQHRYPVMYSGKTIVSWQTLKQIPLYNCAAANNGISWCCHDIGGYYKGMEDNELYTRFVQLGVFSPIMKFGSDDGKYYKREPWRWSVKTREITKFYLQLRHKLIPYLYTEAYNYSKYGSIIIQPLYYHYPKFYDDALFKAEYYFGSELFVAPILNKKDYVMNRVIHKFFVPEGIWYDFITGKKFVGNKRYVSFYRDEDYPVFAKAGAIIPMNYDSVNDVNSSNKLEIQIFPGKSNSYNLYEDDGITDKYKNGDYIITNIDYKWEKDNYKVVIKPVEGKNEIIPSKRDYVIKFRNTTGVETTEAYIEQNIFPTKNYKDDNNFVVEINDVPTTSQLTVICKGENIDIEVVQLISEDFEGIISDLPIDTSLKETIDNILFGELPIAKKRIEIRKLTKKGLDRKFVDLFLKLLEYLQQL